MQKEIRARLDSLPKTEASFVEPMECLSVSKLTHFGSGREAKRGERHDFLERPGGVSTCRSSGVALPPRTGAILKM